MIFQIQTLLDNGQECQEYDLSKYDWDVIAKQTVEVYKKL